MSFRCLLLLLPLAVLAACGLADDPRDDDDKNIYIENRITDPAFRAFCLASYDLDGDGRLSRYEARRVLDMSCARLGILSLQGIAEFGRLQKLDCSGNDLTTLDLDANGSIVQLDCRDNSLTSLYINKLGVLDWLDCSGNALTVVELPSSGVLSYIVIAKNDLRSTLDVSRCAQTILRLDALVNPLLIVIYKSSKQRILQLSIDGQTQLVDH